MIQEIISSTNLKAAPFQRLKLSPNDWLIPPTVMTTCIYFYDIHQWSAAVALAENRTLFLHCERLVRSLKDLLNYYPYLAGILTVNEPDYHAYVEYDRSQGGISFVSTAVDIEMSEIPLSTNEFDIRAIIPLALQLANSCDPVTTLFHVRHTRFACGSVALGVSLNHQLADGHSLFQLIKDWSRLYRRQDHQPIVSHQRNLLEPDEQEIEERRRSNPEFDHRKSLAIRTDPRTSIAVPSTTENIVTKVFRFSADELERMKSNALSHLPSPVSYLSTFEVLTAHLHRHVMLARQHSPTTLTRIFISTNTRPRLSQPKISSTYFGNGTMFSYVEVLMFTVIEDKHLSLIATQIHQAIERNHNDDIRTTLAWTRSQPDPRKIAPTCRLNDADFTISAWNKMGMHSNADFESNVYPYRILLPPEAQYNGAAHLLSTEKQDASIDICLGLEIHQMERLESNVDFRKYRYDAPS